MREMPSSDGASLLHGGAESSSGDARGARRDGIDADHDENAESSSTCLGALKAEPLLVKTIVGVMLGIVVGSITRATNPTPRAVELIGFPGELFMRLLRALIIPLVILGCCLLRCGDGCERARRPARSVRMGHASP